MKNYPLIILFICPNQDNFHAEEYVAYLLIPGFEFLRKKNKPEEEESSWTFYLKHNEQAFILMDDPIEAWQTALIGMFANPEIIRYPHLCAHCRAKGIKSSH